MGIRLGVVGTGRLGRQHVRICKELDQFDSVVCYDIVDDKCLAVAKEYGATAVKSLDKLLKKVDAVSVVVPTKCHAEVALTALARGKDVFLEKPMAASVAEAEEILAKAEQSNLILQIGHVERFNPAVAASFPLVVSPSFIEVERLSSFSLRGTDVSVVMDLMIHDLDLLLMLLEEWPVEIRAKGAGVLTGGADIVNVRLEFPGGCVANATASRVSMESSRMFRIFSPSQYLSIDLKHGKIKHIRKSDAFYEKMLMIKEEGSLGDEVNLNEFLNLDEFTAQGEEPLRKELNSFADAVLNRKRPLVTGGDGLQALRLASEILQKMNVESTS